MSARLRLAMFTPLPPARTGTAEYAEQLVAELAKIVDLRVFDKVRAVNLKNFDAVIYQVANNPYHTPFYNLALEHPGIVVLHEVNLHDLIKGETLHRGKHAAYLREIMYEVFGTDLHNSGRGVLFDMPQPRTFTMLRRLLDRTPRCIVHSNFAERMLRQKSFAGPVAIIPHGSSVRNVDGEPYRRALGVSAGSPVIGLFGYQRPDKRALVCFQAFEELLQSHPGAHLVVAGESHAEVPLREWVLDSGLKNQVHELGYRTLADYDGNLAACDIILNLRHPTFGETSGTMMRAFGLGKTVIVSNLGACLDLPDVCLRIPADEFEGPVLAECMKWLLETPGRLQEIGRRAQRWVSQECSWPRVAQMYASFAGQSTCNGSRTHTLNGTFPAIKSVMDAGKIESYLKRWIDPASSASAYFHTHARRLIRTIQSTPPGSKQDRVLEMGCYLQITPALRDLLGYGEVRGTYLGGLGETIKGAAVANDGERFECFIDLFDADFDPFPYPDAYFSTVLCCEVLEHLEHDPMQMMTEIHRVLKPGGVLVLTTPNITSLGAIGRILDGMHHPASFRRYSRPRSGGALEPGHSREYTPDEIRLLLADSGFVVISVQTYPYGETDLDSAWVLPVLRSLNRPTSLRDDCIFGIGQKETLPRQRYPAWLYGD